MGEYAIESVNVNAEAIASALAGLSALALGVDEDPETALAAAKAILDYHASATPLYITIPLLSEGAEDEPEGESGDEPGFEKCGDPDCLCATLY